MGKRIKNGLDEVADLANLEQAWKHIWSNAKKQSKNTKGIDNVSLYEFNLDYEIRLKKISKRLKDKSYLFSDLKPFFVPKANGKTRLICVPTVEDRIVQRAILQVLNKLYGHKFDNGISYGFITNKTVKDAAAKACTLRKSKPWVYKTDITAFFDNVDRELLNAKVKSVVKHKSLYPLLFSIIKREVKPTSVSQARNIKLKGIHTGKGIRQGMPLSPFFANLFLDSFDNAVMASGMNAVRYADDLIFLADSKAQCIDIDNFCRASLKKIGLDIPVIGAPNSKTFIHEPNEIVEFLGLGLVKVGTGYELILTSEQLKTIRNELLQLGSIKQLLDNNIKLASLGNAIESRVSGYKAAYSDCVKNFKELENELKDVHQKVLRKIYQDDLKIDLRSLPSEQRKFLGLT